MFRFIAYMIVILFLMQSLLVFLFFHYYYHQRLYSYLNQPPQAERAISPLKNLAESSNIETLYLYQRDVYITSNHLYRFLTRQTLAPVKIIGATQPEMHQLTNLTSTEYVLDGQSLYRDISHLFSVLFFSMLILTLLMIVGMLLMIRFFHTKPLEQLADNLENFQHTPQKTSRNKVLSKPQGKVFDLLEKQRHLAILGLGVNKINHDLRNILSNTSLLAQRLLPPEESQEGSQENKNLDPQKTVRRLIASLERGITLCEQYLNYGRPKKAQTEVKPVEQKFNLHALLEEISEDIARLSKRDFYCENQIPPDFEIASDKDHVFRIFLNLIKNAVEAGANRITIRLENSAHQTHVDIEDNGPGIGLRVRAGLFSPLTQSGGGSGFGLGLPIAQELARDLKGDLALKKTDSEGTIFRLTLPDSLS